MLESAILICWHKDLFQLFDQYTITTYTDVADLVCDLFYIFHLFQFPQHRIILHQLRSVQQATGTGGFFTAHDGIGLGFLAAYENNGFVVAAFRCLARRSGFARDADRRVRLPGLLTCRVLGRVGRDI